MKEPRTFSEGVLGGRESVKGFRMVATDGDAGRVSWATYAPGESYLVLTIGKLRRTHRVVPAGVVTAVSDGEVRVGLSREQINRLPEVPHPEASVQDPSIEETIHAVALEYWLNARPS